MEQLVSFLKMIDHNQFFLYLPTIVNYIIEHLSRGVGMGRLFPRGEF